MAVINIYINNMNGKAESTLVDESTIHSIGEEINIDSKQYVVLEIDNRSHIDYATEIHINYVADINSIRRDRFGNY